MLGPAVIFIVLVVVLVAMGVSFEGACVVILIGCFGLAFFNRQLWFQQKTTNDDNQEKPKSSHEPKVSETAKLETTIPPKRAIQVIIQYYESKDYGLIGHPPTIELDANHNKVLIKSAFKPGGGCVYERTYDISANQKADNQTEVVFYVTDRLQNTPSFWMGQENYSENFPGWALQGLREELELVLYKNE